MSRHEVHHPAGEFRPSGPHHESLRSPKHKPGVKASPYDEVPEFEAETLPAGSAPAESTYQPQPTDQYPSAADMLPGATSADLNKGLGKPMQGETSNEIRHEGAHHRKRQGAGYEGVGSSGAGLGADLERLEREDTMRKHEGARGKGMPAEYHDPESAGSVSSGMREHRWHENRKR